MFSASRWKPPVRMAPRLEALEAGAAEFEDLGAGAFVIRVVLSAKLVFEKENSPPAWLYVY